MGSAKKIVSSAVHAVSLGTIDLNKKKKSAGSSSAVSELQQEANQTAKQRRALFMTEGEALGDEVFDVNRKKRGILGN